MYQVSGFFLNITCKSRTHGNNNSNEIVEVMDNIALVRLWENQRRLDHTQHSNKQRGNEE